MTEGSFARCVPDDVLEQIRVREEKFASPNKTVEEIEAIHGNTVWCLLRSGIDTPKKDSDRFKMPSTHEGREEIMKTCTNEYALMGVLGGELHPVNGTGEFNNSGKLSGVQLLMSDNTGKAYRDTTQGHKPIPGISGFTVQTKDTWGMILEATINIKVWSRDDLEDMDRIYFKPGFPALFEWGHTLFFTPDGKVEKNQALMVSNNRFFEGGKFSDLDKEVYKARQENSNREAVFGYITNFSWSFNPDGSFNCTLKILSKGGVLEGLRMSKTDDKDNSDKQGDESWWKISDYHGILKRLHDNYQKVPAGTFERQPELGEKIKDISSPEEACQMPGLKRLTKSKTLLDLKDTLGKGTPEIKLPAVPGNLQSCPVIPVVVSSGIFRRGLPFFYMTLRSLLHLINCIDGGRGGECYWITTSQAKFGHSGTNEYKVAMPSLNPYIAIKPSQTGDYAPDSMVFRDTILSKEECGGLDEILNIWVSYNVFVSLVEQEIREAKERYNLKKVITNLLGQIQKAFGNVNNFSIWNDQSLGGSCFEIVDLNMVVSSEKKELPVLGISGLKNTVIQISAQSDVTNDLVNEMAIAATAPRPGSEGSDNGDECLVFWGENCVPRWVTEAGEIQKEDPEETQKQKEDAEKAYKEWVKTLRKFYRKFRISDNTSARSGDGGGSGDTEAILESISSKFADLQLSGERYYKTQVQEDQISGAELQPGIIPFKATFTLLGISRLYIGNTFRVRNGIFPRKYDNWGYIITGIEHKVINNQWFTTLKTNYYPVLSNMPRNPIHEHPLDDGVVVRGVTGERLPRREASSNLDYDCNLRKAFIEDSGIDYGAGINRYGGLCARYTYNWARAFVKGKASLKSGAVLSRGRYIPTYYAGGNANTESYWKNLEALGYGRGAEQRMTATEIAQLRDGKVVGNQTVKKGDVLVYESVDGSQYHTCFYDGTRWCSDTDQGTANCYRSGGPFKVRLFSAPAEHPDWQGC